MTFTNEQILLGELIGNGSKLTEVRAIIADGDIFQDTECGRYYDAFIECLDIHGELDLVTVSDSLKIRQLSPEVLIEWSMVEYSARNIAKHARIVAEQFMKREGAKTILSLNADFQETIDPLESVDSAISKLMSLRGQFQKEHSTSLSIIVKETQLMIDRHYEGKPDSIKFGFVDIDNVTGGMERGNLIIYAAKAKRGKSTKMLQTIFYNAIHGVPCLLFSTEMRRTDLMLRYAMIVQKIKWLDYIQRKLSSGDRERLKKQMDILNSKCKIQISDKVSSIIDIVAESERMIQKNGTRLIAVDYIQRVVPVSKKSNENREREIASITNGLKNIAFKNDISLIALSQLNDNMQTRESRSIEQEMDKMLTINEEDKDEITPDGKGVIIGIKIQQRMGASGNFGDVKMIYDKEFGYWKSFLNSDGHDEPIQTEPIF